MVFDGRGAAVRTDGYKCLVCGAEGRQTQVWWVFMEEEQHRYSPFCSPDCKEVFKSYTADERFLTVFPPVEDVSLHQRRQAAERASRRAIHRHARGADVTVYEPHWTETEPEAPCIWHGYVGAGETCPDCATQVLSLEGVMR